MDTLSHRPVADLPLAQKRELLAELLRKKADKAKHVPLSFAQQRLWFLDQLAPGNPFYNITRTMVLAGPLEKAALEESLHELVRRHEVLRTRFVVVEGQAVQEIVPLLHIALPLEDCSQMPEDERQAVVNRLATEEAKRPFDLAVGPLLRVRLLRLGKQEHALLLSMHHIVADGWSMGVLFRELGALYAAFCAGKPSPLTELPVQYADYTLWQREWFTGAVQQEQLSYWKEQLADVPRLLLSTDHPRPAVQSFTGAYEPFSLSPEVTRQLKRLSQHEGVTLFMTLLAGFQVLLARYSGQDDIAIGTGIANRTRSELEGLIGFFVNTLVLRTNLAGNPTVRELLQRVREVTLGAYAHQDLPFEQLVEELHPQRDPGYNPLFQVIIGLQNAPQEPLELAGLRLQLSPTHSGTTKFDIHLSLWEAGERLSGLVEYSTDLFETSTIRRMLTHYECVLTSMVTDSAQAISTLPLLVDAEYEALQLWNVTQMEYPADRCLSRLFEQQVERTPERIALSFEDGMLSYGELNRRANQLAHLLCTAGIAGGDLVGLYLERSPALIIGMLAILKVGAAYVPLDVAYPRERITFLMQDTQMKVVLTQHTLLDQLPLRTAQMVCLDDEDERLSQQGAGNLERAVPSTALAYVIYTSGSTGMPKGVAVPQRAVSRLVLNTNYCQVDATDRIIQASNTAFDAATFEIWGALLHGAQVVGVSRDITLSPQAFAAYLEEQRISILFLTTALFNQVAQEVPGAFGGLRYLLFGGEAVTPRWVRRVVAQGRPEHLLHVYGPTENTTFSTWYPVMEVAEEATTIAIGYPLANSQTYVLDSQMQLVPIGVAGELYVGGDGLAQGYLRRPDVTAERFVPHPFSAIVGARLYKTGDLVRRVADGAIEFLARLDTQVKLRGFRVELSEIEAVLNQHAGVQEAVVAVHEDAADQKRLVAYIVADLAALKAQSQEKEQVAHWQMIFDERIYGPAVVPSDPTFHLAGWKSSATGEPFPAEDMQTWLDDTLQIIEALRPQRVLEIGCGTGMLLFRLAPRCQQYHGTDISATSLAYLREQLSSEAYLLPQVELSQRGADDFHGWQPGSFDTIILNSVVQYFPDVHYLLRVLDGALRLLAPGGHIFVGDVRSLPLLEVFHTMVELERPGGELALAVLRERIRQRIHNEEELLVDPRFFTHLSRTYAGISHVRVMPKRGRYINELSRFRYQVVLRVGDRQAERLLEEGNWLDWRRANLSLPRLCKLLAEQSPRLLGLARVPNARLTAALNELAGQGSAVSALYAEVLREALHSSVCEAVEPEDLWRLAEAFPYDVAISWARHTADGSYDVLLCRREGKKWTEEPALQLAESFPVEAEQPGSWSSYTNWPLQRSLAQRLLSQLRPYLQEQLPEYMVPSTFIALDALPLSPNGKVDRRALPAPQAQRPELAEAYVAPRTPTEELLADVWATILGLERVGVYDNFFDLGGHSLLATQLHVRLRETFQQQMPLRDIFEHPTIAGLARLLQIRQMRGEQVAPFYPLVPRPRPVELPLSFAQERLWFLAQLEPDAPFYTMVTALMLTGKLDVAALEQSVNTLVERHEALRTRFEVRGGQPIQVIEPALRLSIAIEDVPDELPEVELQERLRQRAREEAARPFDVSKGPLLRVRLLRYAPLEHLLLLSMHHIIGDGWSLGVLFRELNALYTAFHAGGRSPLADLPIQYADYTLWQREWYAGALSQELLAYWTRQLSDLPQLALPTDRPRPGVQRFRGRYLRFALAPELCEHLRRLSLREGVTLFMTLLAGFCVLLARYSGQSDIVVGTPIANRMHSQLEGLIGLLVNTLMLRTRLNEQMSVRELLRQVRQGTLEAYAHQDQPFEKLVEALKPERSLSYNPLFQVMFALQNAPRTPLELPGITVHPLDIEYNTARFDLTFNLIDTPEGLTGGIEYDCDIFNEQTMQRLVLHYEQMLRGMLAQVEQPVAALSLLTAGEEEQLRRWNATEVDYPREDCLHERFERQVGLTPEAVAVVFEDGYLTYGDLNCRANALAAYLRQRDIGPEMPVAICMERSLELLIALLGILKAGGCYAPLDPAHPQERLAFVLRDIQATILLTQQQLMEQLPRGLTEVICLDSEWEEISRRPAEQQAAGVHAQNLAYVLSTSGSSGVPKAVGCIHQGVINLLADFQSRKPLAAGAHCSCWTSASFDVSVYECFSALLVGGALYLVPEGARADGEAFFEWLARNQIQSAYIPPFLLEPLGAWLVEPSRKLDVQRLLVGVEPIDEALLAGFLQRLPGLHSINGYGPTEATICATLYDAITQEHGSRRTPLGRPVQNMEIYILDSALRLQPPGIAGELFIGGAGLARGYLNRPELTAERFIPHPFSRQPGLRLYRTGDMARYGLDGNVEFLGRADQQVKLRGFRIELGEIEAVLSQHPQVREVVVLLREERSEEKHLVAYIVAANGQAPGQAELHAFLRRQLPEYMLPATYVPLDALPLTVSGKVDRRALPAPEREYARYDEAYTAPRGPVEERLAALWADVLGLERVGIHDNFFDVGGHSLLAMRLLARIREDFQTKLAVRSLFEAPTVAELAATIVRIHAEQTDDEMLAQFMAELEELSEEEAGALLLNAQRSANEEESHG